MYKATDVIMMLCIAAPSYADRPVALVYPVSGRFFDGILHRPPHEHDFAPRQELILQHEGNLRHHLKAANIPCTGTPSQWVNDATIKQYILDQMLIIAKKNGLDRAEMVKDVILTPEEWYVPFPSPLGLSRAS